MHNWEKFHLFLKSSSFRRFKKKARRSVLLKNESDKLYLISLSPLILSISNLNGLAKLLRTVCFSFRTIEL